MHPMRSLRLVLLLILSIPALISSQTPLSKSRRVCSDISEHIRGVKLAFQDAEIPAAINTRFEPEGLLTVAWPSPNKDEDPVYTYPGRHLFDNVTIPQPTFTVAGLPRKKNGPFIIIMLDPDVPSTEKPSIRDFVGSDFYVDYHSSVLINRTAAIVSWRRPSPPRRSQQERYVFLMYDQPSAFDNTVNLDNTTFRKFDVADFALKNGLGSPIAGMFVNIESNASCWRDGCK